MTDEEKTSEESKPKAKKTKASKAPAKKAAAKAEPTAQEPKQYAVIRTGGKQFMVSPGDQISIPKSSELTGDTVDFTDVLAAGTIGQGSKILAGKSGSLGVTVKARIVGPKKDKKVLIFKKRRRGGYTKKQGHRQEQLRVVVESINL